MTGWTVVNGHILGQCEYLRSLDRPWKPEARCDCADVLEDDPFWGRSDEEEDDEPATAEEPTS